MNIYIIWLSTGIVWLTLGMVYLILTIILIAKYVTVIDEFVDKDRYFFQNFVAKFMRLSLYGMAATFKRSNKKLAPSKDFTKLPKKILFLLRCNYYLTLTVVGLCIIGVVLQHFVPSSYFNFNP